MTWAVVQIGSLARPSMIGACVARAATATVAETGADTRGARVTGPRIASSCALAAEAMALAHSVTMAILEQYMGVRVEVWVRYRECCLLEI